MANLQIFSNIKKEEPLENLMQLYSDILTAIGEDPEREGLKKTPKRAAKALHYLVHGYDLQLDEIVNNALFSTKSNELVIVKDIELFSLCEHHLLPFIGKCHVGYIPNGKILGLSKIPRIVEMFSRRLQIQETLNQQIADAIMQVTNAHGVGVVIEAKHLCIMARGIEKQHTKIKTSCMLGSFKKNKTIKDEFLKLLESQTPKTCRNFTYGTLELNNYNFKVHLGHSDQERATPQVIFLDLTIRFPTIPHASISDDLKETICYKELRNAIEEFLLNKEFHLIEYLGKQLFDFLKKYLNDNLQIYLRLKKPQPLKNLESSIFTIGDFRGCL